MRPRKDQRTFEEIHGERSTGMERPEAIRNVMMKRLGRRKGRLNKCRG